VQRSLPSKLQGVGVATKDEKDSKEKKQPTNQDKKEEEKASQKPTSRAGGKRGH
jgi:hypothetical protein